MKKDEIKLVEMFKKDVRLNPKDARAHQHLGEAYTLIGKYKEALTSYSQSIKIKPHSLAYCGIGFAYHSLGKYNESLESYEKAKSLKAHLESEAFGKVIAYCGQGRVYLDICKYNEAIKSLKSAINLDSDFPDSYYYLGVAYLGAKRKTMALKQYGILKQLDIDKAKELFELVHKGKSI